MMETLVQMVRDLDIRALAEGIETAEEAEACIDLGFDLAQGFYLRPPLTRLSRERNSLRRRILTQCTNLACLLLCKQICF